MRKSWKWLLLMAVIGVMLISMSVALASAKLAISPDLTFTEMHLYGFCKREPAMCKVTTAKRIAYTPQVGVMLSQVQLASMGHVEYTSDQEQFGKFEVFHMPRNGKGDCEDQAFHKKMLLMERGVPSSALMLATLYISGSIGTYHALLIVRTDKGDIYLDNNGVTAFVKASPSNWFWLATQNPNAMHKLTEYKVKRGIFSGLR